MESRKIVYHETGIVALGVTVCTGVMILVFALLESTLKVSSMGRCWGRC